MSNYQFANNATTTIGSSVSSGATTITVATGQGALFPSPTGGQYFTATIFSAGSSTGTPNEIVKVTARTGDTMTVVRAQEGTAATSWNVGDTFANYPTAAFLNAIPLTTDVASVVQAQAGNYAVDSGIANAGVVTLSPAPASLAALVGVPIRVLKMGSANTGTYTLNVNGLGANGVFLGGNALASGQLPGSQIFEVIWDGAEFELISYNGRIAAALSNLTMVVQQTATAGAFSFAVPANALPYAFAYLTGAGGAAAGTTSAKCGGAGGAGATCLGPLLVTPGGTISGTVGAAGIGGATGSDGTAGGTSTLISGATTWTANGGDRGQVSSFVAGGNGGSAMGAPVNINGGDGLDGNLLSTNAQWACGGASFWGGGGRAGSGSGGIGNAYGAGGGAAYGGNDAGANGAHGVVIVQFWTI